MPDLTVLFLQIAVIIATGRLVAWGFRKIGQPEVVGEMAAGILLGPSLLGRISPGAFANLFPSNSLGPLYALSQVGLVLFMFLVGLEVRPGMIRKSAKSIVVASQASIFAPFVCGALLAWVIYPAIGQGVPRLPFVLFMGAAMGITAFPVLARILTHHNMTHSRVGVFAISCAAVDDVTAWCLLAVITVIAHPDTTGMTLPVRFAALAVYIAAMLFVIRPLLRRMLRPEEAPGLGQLGGVMVFLLTSVLITEGVGVHALFGAFLAGLVMPRGGKLETALRSYFESLTLVLLLPLFFAWNGLRTSIGLLNSAGAWELCGVIIVVAVASKLLVSALCVRTSGMPWRDSFAVGILVNTRGLVELVILNAGLDLHILSPALFSMRVIMALVTTFMKTPLIDWVLPAPVPVFP